jgi:excisionase family DNA binding protein
MARPLVTIEEAARSLGISVEELNEMREQGQIHAYRDGGSWKFREDEVERVQAERAMGKTGDSGLSLDDPAGGSSILGAAKPGGSSVIGGAGGSDPALSLDDEPPTAKIAQPAAGLGAAFEDLDDLSLDLESGSAVGKKAEGGSALNLAGDDEDLVLEPAADSDITRDASASGIQLSTPSDSGVSLEEPLEIGGSSVDSFELGEDSAISFDEKASPDSPTQVKAGADDDFLLTPLQTTDDDESDSGSQVIALDDEDTLDIAAASGPHAVATTLLEEDQPDVGAAGASAAGAPAPAGGAVSAPAPEVPYTGWQVTGLVLCTLVLFVAGMMMFELMRHMWSWEEPYTAHSAIMDVISGWFSK